MLRRQHALASSIRTRGTIWNAQAPETPPVNAEETLHNTMLSASKGGLAGCHADSMVAHGALFELTCTCFSDIFNLAEVSNDAFDPAVSRIPDVKDCHLTFASVKKLINEMLSKKA